MQPAPLKVGDKVRLTAGGKTMTVTGMEDYGNMVVCEWQDTQHDTFPARSLVRVDAE
jgi:uncharacterized protein YodC (DUF2158 family)